MGSVAAIVVAVIVLAIVMSSGNPKTGEALASLGPRDPEPKAPKPLDSPGPSGIARGNPPPPDPAPQAKSPEELPQEEAGRKRKEIQEAEKRDRLAPDEVRRRYAEFARDYADRAKGRTTADWLKATEPAVAEVKADLPKDIDAPKPFPAELKPPQPPPAVPAAEPPQDPKRLPVPDAARQREVEALVRKAFNLDQARTPKDKADLARTLLQNAAKSGAKDVELYVLLRQARTLAAQGADAMTALEAIDSLAAAFEVDGLAEKVDLLMKAAVKGADAAAWAGAAIEVADEASEADDYETALKVATRAEALARVANDRGLQDATKERGKEFVDLKRVADGLKPHFKMLETNPDDPAANAAVGKFVSLVKGDWKRGLPLLAKGSEPALKALAEQELAGPADAASQAALAEGWAAHAEKETPIYKVRARGRAAEWLGRAIPGLTGLAKITAERKLAALGPAPGSRDRLTFDLGGGVRMEFVYIKPGTFVMGDKEPPGPEWQADERPEHKVTITKGFYMGKYEVTQAQWDAVTGKNSAKGKGPYLPVEQLSWEDCQNFVKTFNEKLKNQLKGRVAAMPTEAQWEHACRAGAKTRWSFGDDEKAQGDYAWTNANSGGQTHPVGQKKPNAWGLYDMQGNVWEWCQDWAGPYAGDAMDPTGPAIGDRRVLRGGGWGDAAACARPAFRYRGDPSRRDLHDSFRACLP